METFVVRVWTPAEAEAKESEPPRLKGFVTHARSGREGRFAEAEQLVAWIAELLREEQPEPTSMATGSSVARRQARP